MSDSSSEQHFQARKGDRKELTNLSQPAAPKQSAPANDLDDDDDGFNQDEAQELFNDKPAAEPDRGVDRESSSREVRKAKKMKRLKRHRKNDDEDSYRGRSEDQEEAAQKPKRVKQIKKNEAPRKQRAPPKTRQESTKDIERRQFQEEAKVIASKLIEEMNRRADSDKHNVEIKKQALEKLNYLKEMSSMLENKYVQYYFLEEDGLQAMEKWIRKYPNGEDPSYTVRKRVLEIILSLPTKSSHISKSQELAALIEKLKKYELEYKFRSGGALFRKRTWSALSETQLASKAVLSHYFQGSKVGVESAAPNQQTANSTEPLSEKEDEPEPKDEPRRPAIERLLVKTKYYTAQPTIRVVTWDELDSLSLSEIECLLILSKVTDKAELQDQYIIIDRLDSLIQRYNPNSYALIVDSPQETTVSVEKLFQGSQTFLELIFEDTNKLAKLPELPAIPKSLLEDATGIVRVVLLLESTTWKHMSFAKQELTKTESTSKQLSSSEVQKPPKPAGLVDNEEDTLKIERQMDEFADIMMEMCSIKNSALSDGQRRLRAEQVLMRMMAGLQDQPDE